jgi:hypothetical protein
MRGKIFLSGLQTFSTAWAGKFSTIAGPQKLVGARILSYVRYRALRRQNSAIEIGVLFFPSSEKLRRQEHATRRGLIAAILLLPFAVNCG